MKKILLTSILMTSVVAYAQIQLEVFASSLPSLTDITHANDARLFAVQQNGSIKIVQANGTVNSTDFINISSKITNSGEQGLLGMAFHPNYSTNGYFFLYYNNTSGNIIVARYKVNATNPNIADVSSEKIILNISKPFSNHNGGSLHFDPSGYLWVGTGDGGSGGDPNNYAQNINSLLGKILRIDINTETNPYNIPPTNPFVNIAGADEVWSYGLRNPWKYTFDTTNNMVYIADVGQNEYEEINKMPISQAAINYGWRCYEANAPYNTTGCPATSTLTFPVATYSLTGTPCAITGGFVYRGSLYPDLIGKYFFADYCTNQIGIMSDNNSFVWVNPANGSNFSTFGINSNKEIFVGGRGSGGIIYRLKSTNLNTLENNYFKVNIAPNPAKDHIVIQGIKKSGTILEIYSLDGKLVVSEKISSENSKISISHLAKGVYMAVIKENNDRKFSQKLIIE